MTICSRIQCIKKKVLVLGAYYYLLNPITYKQFQLIVEGHEIWLRYRDAPIEQINSSKIYGSLPEDQKRYIEIQSLTGFLFDPSRHTLKLKASFRPLTTKFPLPNGHISHCDFEVMWNL